MSPDAWVFGLYKCKFSGHDRHNLPTNLLGMFEFHPLCRTEKQYKGVIKELLMRSGGIPLFIYEFYQGGDFGGLWVSQSQFFVWHGKSCVFAAADMSTLVHSAVTRDGPWVQAKTRINCWQDIWVVCPVTHLNQSNPWFIWKFSTNHYSTLKVKSGKGAHFPCQVSMKMSFMRTEPGWSAKVT